MNAVHDSDQVEEPQKRGYRLQSSDFWYAPGMAQNMLIMERTGDGHLARRMLKEGYNLPDDVIEAFLTGKIVHKVDGDVVVLELPDEEGTE